LDIGDAIKLSIEKLEALKPRKIASSKGEKK